MNNKYDGLRRPEQYWEAMLDSGAEREIILMLLKKIDQLNERVYEAEARAEDAYQEMVRLEAAMRQRD